jgi:hypothetical protein
VEFPEPAFHAFENGNSVASLDELEEIAIAPGVPIQEFFYDFRKAQQPASLASRVVVKTALALGIDRGSRILHAKCRNSRELVNH